MSCSPTGLVMPPLPSLELLNVRAGISHSRESDPREDRIVAELATDGSAVTLLLARRVALLATRLEWSSRHEVVATATRVRQATTDFAAAREAEAQRRFDAVPTDPGQRAALLDLPEGVDLVVATLRSLRPRAGAAAPGTWTDADDRELTRCLGAGNDATGTPATLGPTDRVAAIDAELERLAAHRRTLDLAAVECARTEAADAALVGTDPATLLARRYEAATERALYRALKEIRAVQQPPRPRALGDEAAVLAQSLATTRSHLAQLAADAAPPALGSFGVEPPPGRPPLPAAAITVGHSAQRGQSRFVDRKQRPRLSS